MLVRSDVEAYLSVLGYPTAYSQKANTVGCLVRIEDQLLRVIDRSDNYRATYDMVRFREKLNGYLPVDHPLLRSITRQLSNILSSWLENPNAFG